MIPGIGKRFASHFTFFLILLSWILFLQLPTLKLLTVCFAPTAGQEVQLAPIPTPDIIIRDRHAFSHTESDRQERQNMALVSTYRRRRE